MNSFRQNFLVTAIQRGLKFSFTPGHYRELFVLRLYKRYEDRTSSSCALTDHFADAFVRENVARLFDIVMTS